MDDDDPQVSGAALHAVLEQRGHTLATAESLTGGALSDLVSAAPGASTTFLGGVVAYDSGVKVRVLGVDEQTVEQHGVVSRECATEMAVGVRRLLGTTWGVATTGVAGPTEQEGKPVGTVFLGVAGPGGEAGARGLHLEGDRADVRAAACEAAVALLLEWLRPQ